MTLEVGDSDGCEPTNEMRCLWVALESTGNSGDIPRRNSAPTLQYMGWELGVARKFFIDATRFAIGASWAPYPIFALPWPMPTGELLEERGVTIPKWR